MKYNKTVDYVNINKFMGTWYVQITRPTFLEKDAYNSVETYNWNVEDQRIDIGFTYNKGSFDGRIKSYPQKGFIHNTETNAHWKVQPIWPLKLDYLVIALADDYSWTAIGVPNGNYLWIMTRESQMDKKDLDMILDKVKNTGYPINNLEYIKHQ